ncbi:MAG: adenosylcobinamide-GDP ribazoletransferase [Propylenella sp.]
MDDFAARLRRLPDDTLIALAFFSRVPLGQPTATLDLEKGAAGWPIAGLVLAIVPAVLFLIARAADFPPLVAAVLVLALFAALTGAMHEDGLADTFDGFGGDRTREEKLAIMRDSRLGTYGALALFFTLVVKLAALSSIGLRPGLAALAIICAAVISRTLALWHWRDTPPARTDGMAQAAGRPDYLAFAVGLAVGAVAALALLVGFGLAALIGVLMAAAGVGIFSAFTARQIGGHTGDTVGAAQQIAEALLLAGLATAGTSMIL